MSIRSSVAITNYSGRLWSVGRGKRSACAKRASWAASEHAGVIYLMFSHADNGPIISGLQPIVGRNVEGRNFQYC